MKHWQWYNAPFFVAGIVLVGTQLAAILPISRGTVALVGTFAVLQIIALLFMVVWGCWVLPVIGELEVPRSRSPRVVLKSLRRWRIWVPTQTAGGAVVGSILLIGVQLAHQDTMPSMLIAPVLLGGILMGTIPVSSAVSRHFTRRYRVFIRRMSRCFECGYDLRGNPEAERCPECGAPLPDHGH